MKPTRLKDDYLSRQKSLIYAAHLTKRFAAHFADLIAPAEKALGRAVQFLTITLLLAAAQLNAQTPADGVYFFYSETCEHCRSVAEELLIPLAKSDPQIRIHYLETGNSANYRLLLEAEELLAPGAERVIPVLLAGDTLYPGEQAIRSNIDAITKAARATPSPLPPELKGIANAVATELPSFTEDPGDESCDEDACSRDTIWAAYFYQTGCKNCNRSDTDLKYIRSLYPKLSVRKYNIFDKLPLAQFMAKRAKRGESFEAPAIFIGDDALIGEREFTPKALESLVKKYEKGAPLFWTRAEKGDASVMAEAFRRLGALTVFAAGLIDGLNPCAFATIIFFVSYLALSGRKGGAILAVGSVFTAGVFLAYLAVGFGFYKILDMAGSFLSGLGQWVYGITALVCALFAILSFQDFLKARKGLLSEMTLSLPDFFRSRINATIRQGRHAKNFVLQAFFAGVIISFLELACTGQIYLPTIIYVQSIPELKTRAQLYLILYNIAFVIPLIVVFFLAWFGTSSQRLTLFFQKNAAPVKLAMAILFLTLGVWLACSVLL